MAWFRRKKSVEEMEKSGVSIRGFSYPVDFIVPTVGDVYNVPVFPFPMKMIYNIAMYSDVVETINRALTNETFRNGIYLEERFKSKCVKCGAEYEEYVPVCLECGGLTRKPDLTERKKLKEWYENFRNSFGEDLITIMKQIDMDVNRIDNGFLVLIKEYYYTKDGRLFGYKIKDVMRGSPFAINLLVSKYGMGRDARGNYYYVCPEHRDVVVKKEKEGVYFCEKCGKQMLPAWFVVDDKGKKIYYAKDEIYHVKKWSNTQGYGIPWELAVMTKILTLMKMDRLMLKTYSLQRSPKGILVMRGRRDAFIRAWEWLMQKARENPNMVYPLIVEGGENNKRIIEYLDLTPKPDEFNWIDMRNEFRRQIGAVVGVMPLFQADLSVGGGLNNEGLQITVTNRTIEEMQRVWNDVLSWLSYQLGYSDWTLKLYPSEEKDLKAQIERERMRIENARIMRDLGYEPVLVEGVDGIEFRFRKAGESDDSSSAGINIRSIREMLHRESSQNAINEVDGSPEGRGKRPINQGYEGMPSISKGYNDDKVAVRVVRTDGVQQTYYVARNRLKRFIEEHEAKGQKVSVVGNVNYSDEEIITDMAEVIVDAVMNGEDVSEFLTKLGVKADVAFVVSVFVEILKKRDVELLNCFFEECDNEGVNEIRKVITDEFIENWIGAMTKKFVTKYGEAVLSHRMSDCEIARAYIQSKAGSDKYVSDKSVLEFAIGEYPNSVQMKAKNIIWFENGIAIAKVQNEKLDMNIDFDKIANISAKIRDCGLEGDYTGIDVS